MSKSWMAHWIQFWNLWIFQLYCTFEIWYKMLCARTFIHQICFYFFLDNFPMANFYALASIWFFGKIKLLQFNSNGSCVLPCSHFTFRILFPLLFAVGCYPFRYLSICFALIWFRNGEAVRWTRKFIQV